MKILAIDPGNIESGYAVIEMPTFKIIEFGKVDNYVLRDDIERIMPTVDELAIEMVASYGMPVGRDVFETCVWIGRFIEKICGRCKYRYIYRKDEKVALCGNMKAKDANIRQALINRYAKFDIKNGKGAKKTPDTFYGVSADVWSAIAVGVTYWEVYGQDDEAIM